MINTCLRSEGDLPQVRRLGERVKHEVNKQYRTLELEIDGIFRSMLLLKKKKYAAKTIEQLPDGKILYGEELKGLDLVRRDWCVQSKQSGRYVTTQILSGMDNEIVMEKIYTHLEDLAKRMRNGELTMDKFVITKGLSKHPNDYPDAKSMPHVQVAKAMLKNNKPVNMGDHIPYIVTAQVNREGEEGPKADVPVIERVYHPDDIARSKGTLVPDYEWYLSQQILPPIARLCDPIEGMSQQSLAEKLGLDQTKYRNQNNGVGGEYDEMVAMNFTPASMKSDVERFRDVIKLKFQCQSCLEESVLPGVFCHPTDDKVQSLVSGLMCPTKDCENPMCYGYERHFDFMSTIMNKMTVWKKQILTEYYKGIYKCDEPGCGLETRQLSVAGSVCLRKGCNGKVHPKVSERDLHTHLKYLESLFDLAHAAEQYEKREQYGTKAEIMRITTNRDKAMFGELHALASSDLNDNAFNWISPGFWNKMFGAQKAKQ